MSHIDEQENHYLNYLMSSYRMRLSATLKPFSCKSIFPKAAIQSLKNVSKNHLLEYVRTAEELWLKKLSLWLRYLPLFIRLIHFILFSRNETNEFQLLINDFKTCRLHNFPAQVKFYRNRSILYLEGELLWKDRFTARGLKICNPKNRRMFFWAFSKGLFTTNAAWRFNEFILMVVN